LNRLKRREFVALLGGAAAWPLAANSQRPVMPVIGFIAGASYEVRRAAAFLKGLGESGYVEGQNVAVENHLLGGQYERLAVIVSDLVRRRVAVIVTPGSNPAALAAKAATETIPIVFGVNDDPVRLGPGIISGKAIFVPRRIFASRPEICVVHAGGRKLDVGL